MTVDSRHPLQCDVSLRRESSRQRLARESFGVRLPACRWGECLRATRHGRRRPAFGVALHDRYGFVVLEEVEGTGLAVYGNEDPVIYRVIADREA